MFVMTATHGGNTAASTLTWISQCSFHPPLVMIGVQSNSGTHDVIEASGALAVHFLAEDQQEIAQKFFRPPEDGADGRLHGLRYEPGPETGSPLLADLPAWLEARVVDRVARGDHTVYVCEVVGAGSRRPDFAPLALASTPWSYGG
jgi:flavin reductase (DIM6/NTAB) family NADH-FMN oxidoreductase RutF